MLEELEELTNVPHDVGGANDLILKAVSEIKRAQSSEKAYMERNRFLEKKELNKCGNCRFWGEDGEGALSICVDTIRDFKCDNWE